MQTFQDFLQDRLAGPGFSTEDALASFLPLMRQVVVSHAGDMVAPLAGLDALRVENNVIWFEEARLLPPRTNPKALADVAAPQSAALEVVGEARVDTNVDRGSNQVVDLRIGRRDQPLARPVYLPGYVAWEHLLDHHDPLTDVFSLGLILASLACGVDLREPADLEKFVAARGNLFRLRRDLHPVLARAVVQMTELDRHRRPQDLAALLHTLDNYQDQEIDFDFDLARIEGFGKKDLKTRQQIVLARLQERLFEISRRNRLLHYRATSGSIDLTQASVPLSFDPVNIRPDQILTWSGDFRAAITAGREVSLNKYINVEEVLYAPSVLDRIGTDARRDQAEYGFSNLRLVICFLRWANLKATPPERYDSPLVLLPARLKKKKGIRDTYTLEPLSQLAEINPVVRYQFKQLYDVDLPETIDLETTTVEKFYDHLAERLTATAREVELQKIARPQIELIHQRARRQLDQYRRRARLAGRGVRSFMDIDYSYDPANYHPLGLALFTARIRPPATQLREIVQHQPRPRTYVAPERPNEEHSAKAVVERRQSFVHVRQGSDNPYAWQFDLCSVTLGNFRYRKMSLVRDYAALVGAETPSPAFDATFSLIPRPVETEPPAAAPLDDRFHIVPCDPTQAASIARARTGTSYIIQGPPGTGKSQTITNLIADYVARGQRVLFVCEKRAAIDVVYARLRQQGLGPLCCLIHDSQADKKPFVMDLKQTYEMFLGQGGDHEPIPGDAESLRRDRVVGVRRELEPIDAFDRFMRSTTPQTGLPIHQVLRRLVALCDSRPQLSALQQEGLPHYAVWVENADRLERLAAALVDVQADGIYAHHPLRSLCARLADAERPLHETTAALGEAASGLDEIERLATAAELPAESWPSLPALARLVAYGRRIAPLARRGQMKLLDDDSTAAQEFSRAAGQFEVLASCLRDAAQLNSAWRRKLSTGETQIALEQARALQGRFAFINPAWWRLRKTLNASYDFGAHAVRPSWTHVLEKLGDEHRAGKALDQHETKLRATYGFNEATGGFDEATGALIESIAQLRREMRDLPEDLHELHGALLNSSRAGARVEAILQMQSPLDQVTASLDEVLKDYQSLDIQQLRSELTGIEGNLDELNDFLVCLGELKHLPDGLATTIRVMPLDLPALEAAIAARGLEDVYRRNREARRFSGAVRDRHVHRLGHAYDDWLAGNAVAVRERVRARFLDRVRIASLPSSQLDADQKQFKKQYSRGRRELEHEFGKSMRYKSIRDIVADESGLVAKDLKPVWLMSPLSVSDALPLQPDFDVVIFDEASQITLEEAVPSIFRAPQTIVVGDEMQLPPTDFFSARPPDDDELLLDDDEGDFEYDLSSNSFLNHAGKNLPSTMLGWHYRSRSESLISFSNWAFYQGRLLTVPEEQLTLPDRAELRVGTAESSLEKDAHTGTEALLERPVSFHFLENGLYDKRRNRPEAEYIAQLLRHLLDRRNGLTFGVVAFSEAQQSEIESALERLAQRDEAFRERLESEYEREEDGQFVGLLVKNLENIQGDERDVVIMSVCYGHGPDGRMLMNFGPINRSGGEKRLNVAFSRAKHHMVLVSSIQSTDITNEYNDGANCLKNYLRYAAALSQGKLDVGRQVLQEITAARAPTGARGARASDPIVAQLADALQQRGYLVDFSIGQSHFRCDLAVRREGDETYRLGVLVDHEHYYRQTDLLEREMMRPRLLRAFGWQVASVLAKDWYEDPLKLLDGLEEFLRN